MEGKKWMLHHENAPAHASCRSASFSPKTNLRTRQISPLRNSLFPKLKSTLKGRRFESIEGIEGNSLTELGAIKKENHSRTVSKIGKKSGSVVLRVEGSTLKVTRPTSF
jgi:hypothetical protein